MRLSSSAHVALLSVLLALTVEPPLEHGPVVSAQTDDTIEGDECDECNDLHLTPSQVTDTAMLANSSGPLIGEQISLDYLQLLLHDWDKRGGLQRLKSGVADRVAGNTIHVDTAQGRYSIYLSPADATWVQHSRIVETSPWYVDSDIGGQPRLCLQFQGHLYCSYLYEFTTNWEGSLKLIRAEDDKGTSWNLWHGEITNGRSDDIVTAMSAEPAREAMRQAGVAPEDYDDLLVIYANFQAARVCHDEGVAFSATDMKGLEATARAAERRVSVERLRDQAWEEASEYGGFASLTVGYGVEPTIRLCEGLRSLLAPMLLGNFDPGPRPF